MIVAKKQDASTSRGAARPVGLIGGIGLTEVHVYTQQPAPDGKFSGCPHVHAVTDEGYFVLRGCGHVEFHDRANGYRTLLLEPGHYVHFPPLVMHRLVSKSAIDPLVILGMMGNAGLAERGEARIYFGAEVDADQAKFAELISLPKREGLEGALKRRDAAVSAYQELIALWDSDRDAYFAELSRFIETHCRAMAAKAAEFEEQVKQGPIAWANATRERIAALPNVPAASTDVFSNAAGTESAFGMCGVLRPMLTLRTV
jgi:mannose-6-phosphate isomerase-like protein (cupin superfamily)